jgi:hypothetical protein
MVDPIVLLIGKGNLNRIAERHHLPSLIGAVCREVGATLSRHLSEVGEQCSHALLPCPVKPVNQFVYSDPGWTGRRNVDSNQRRSNRNSQVSGCVTGERD